MAMDDLGKSAAEHREELANQIRVLRTEARMSGSELARRLGWSQSRVSRIETGRQLPSVEELQAIAKECKVPRDTTRFLIAMLKGVEQEWSDARRYETFGAQQRHAEVQETEANAKTVRIFQPAIVPGLLQTPEYSRAIATTSGNLARADIESDIELRQERQQLLTKERAKFTFVVTESALWNRFGSAFTMEDQYEHLLRLLSDRVRLAIVPRTAGLPLLPMTGFNLFDDVLVTIETITNELFLQHPSDVDGYVSRFEKLEAVAVSGRAARTIIEEIAADLAG